MSRSRLLAAATVALSLSLWAVPPSSGQVRIIRQVPPGGEERGIARWGPPTASPQSALQTGRTELSGRLSAGATGGGGPSGERVVDFLTDSQVKLVQPLGAAATLSVEATGLRRRGIGQQEQRYGGRLALQGRALALDLSGSYGDGQQSLAGVDRSSLEAFLQGSASATFIPTLPIRLSYRHDWRQGVEQGAQSAERELDQADLKAVGTVGPIGVETDGTFRRERDRLKGLQVAGAGGSTAVTVPLLGFLSLKAGAAPSWNRTEYLDGSSLTSYGVESTLGLVFPFSERFRARLLAGRVDAWSQGKGLAASVVPYQVTWKGELGAELDQQEGLTAAPALQASAAQGGAGGYTLGYDLALPVGWDSGKGFLRHAAVEGRWSGFKPPSGPAGEDQGNWKAELTVAPAATLAVSGEYDGEARLEDLALASNAHRASGTVAWDPDPLLGLQAGYVLAASSERGGPYGLKQEIHGGAALRPRWNLKVYSFEVAELLALQSSQQGPGLLSRASYTMAIPLFAALQVRYHLEWERVSETAPGAGPGDAFRHAFGLSLAGTAVPFSWTVEYVLSHGYRGVRHDLSSAVQVPLTGGFSLQAAVSLSHYLEGSQERLPYLASLVAAWQF